MIEWWQNMHLIQQILALFALPATVILVIQTILLLFGMGQDDAGTGTDADGDAFESTADGDNLEISQAGYETDAGLAPDEPFAAQGSIADYDPGLRLITVRGLVAFFAVGGWVGIAVIDLGAPVWLGAILALLFGLFALWLIAIIFKALMRLQSSGNIQLSRAVGCSGEVYLRIPASSGGRGKVTVLVQERLVEAAAMTRRAVDLPTGTSIRVTGISGGTLLVEPIDEEMPKKE